MNQTINVELTPQQKALLLDGLSYLRNSALLEAKFPTEENDNERNRQVREIENLAERLGGSRPSQTPTAV